MAVDPITAKILAQLAAQAVTDEQARKRLLIIILAPVISLLVLIAFIVYLLTSPLSLFAEWAFGGEELAAIESFQQGYGYNQNLGVFEQDYVDGSGQSYEGVTFTDGGMEVTYYNQLDERWADTMYGTSGTIGQAGCGPTSMAIVISTLTGEAHDPIELSNWSVANGHRCEGNGSYHIDGSEEFGRTGHCGRPIFRQTGGGYHEQGAFHKWRPLHCPAGRDQ